MTKEKALDKLQKQVDRIKTMRAIRSFGPSFTKWRRDTEVAIREIFGDRDSHLRDFSSICHRPNYEGVKTGHNTPMEEAAEQANYEEMLEHAESILMSFIDEINDYWSKDGRSKATALPHPEHRPSMSLHDGDKKKVFVVHGRNGAARNAIFNFLRSLSLQPIEWSEAVRLTGKTSPFIGEILDAAFAKAQAVVVLMTPDDIAYLDQRFRSNDDPPYEKNPTPQARPNVLFEAGMAMGRYPDRTILVELGSLRPFSDIGGRHVVRINNTSQRRHDLAERLAVAGCDIDLSGRDWHSAGDFDSCIESTTDSAIQATSGSGGSLAKRAFEILKPKMVEIFLEMKSDLENDTSQVVREFVVLPSKGVTFNHGKPRFEYYEDMHPALQNKVDLLREHGLVVDVTRKDYPVYRMTEEFVELLMAIQV